VQTSPAVFLPPTVQVVGGLRAMVAVIAYFIVIVSRSREGGRGLY